MAVVNIRHIAYREVADDLAKREIPSLITFFFSGRKDLRKTDASPLVTKTAWLLKAGFMAMLPPGQRQGVAIPENAPNDSEIQDALKLVRTIYNSGLEPSAEQRELIVAILMSAADHFYDLKIPVMASIVCEILMDK